MAKPESVLLLEQLFVKLLNATGVVVFGSPHSLDGIQQLFLIVMMWWMSVDTLEIAMMNSMVIEEDRYQSANEWHP